MKKGYQYFIASPFDTKFSNFYYIYIFFLFLRSISYDGCSDYTRFQILTEQILKFEFSIEKNKTSNLGSGNFCLKGN